MRQDDCPESEALHEPLDSLRLSPGQSSPVDDESVHARPPGTQGEAIGQGCHVVPIDPDDPELSRRRHVLGAEIDARRGGRSRKPHQEGDENQKPRAASAGAAPHMLAFIGRAGSGHDP